MRKRDEVDQRVVRVFLTAAGERLVRKAPGPARGVLPDALEALPPAALRRLDQSVAALLKGMKAEVPAALRSPICRIFEPTAATDGREVVRGSPMRAQSRTALRIA